MPDILNTTLVFLKEKVKDYDGGSTDIVEITNIATLNDGDDFLESTVPIVLSIVNIEEDRVARNPNLYIKNTDPNLTSINKHTNPAQHLNISLLFTAYDKDRSKYLDGISKLEHVIRCFQEKHVFYIDDDGNEVPSPETENHHKLILDIESLKISELNQLWSVLGNKYMPSVLYKMRLITIQNETLTEVGVIEKVKIKLWGNVNENDLAGQIEETEFLEKTL